MVTSWTPQTCPSPGCNFAYIGDPTKPSKVALVEVGRACSAHAGLTGTAHFDIVVAENARKNNMDSIISAFVTGYKSENMTWAFNTQRTLLISFVGIIVTNAIKAQIQNACDLQFGPNKVSVS